MTPRPYLSYSSMVLLEKNPKQWIRQYLYDETFRPNSGMVFGKKMADGLENDEDTGDIALDLMMTKIPKFEIMDKEFTADLKTGRRLTSGKPEIIKILCKPDTRKGDHSAFKEYKTAQKRWTKKQVDESDQITFYATGMFLITSKIPGDIELVEIPTKRALDGKIECTGEIYRHHTVRSMGQILQMMVRMKRAWSTINKICEEELL